MGNKSVFIFPSPSQQVYSVIYHYGIMGWDIYMPIHGHKGFDWTRSSSMGGLLAKNPQDKTKRNIDLLGPPNKPFHGSNRFLKSQYKNFGKIYDQDISVHMVNLKETKINVDLFHVCNALDIGRSIKFAKNHLSGAKLVNHTWHSMDKGKNLVISRPSNLQNKHNSFDFYRHDFEFDILNAPKVANERKGFASFCHNFGNREKQGTKLFKGMNKILKSNNINPIINYGSNIRKQGADIGYSKEKGITGKLITLSQRDAATMYVGLRAVIVFRKNDRGGGIPSHALMTGTPIITTDGYLNRTSAKNVFKNDYNCLVIGSSEDAAKVVMELEKDDDKVQELSYNMVETYKSLHSDEYWEKWKKFLSKSLKSS